MEKLYTEKQYSDMAVQANAEGKKLIKVQKEIEYQVEVPKYEKKLVEVEIYDEQTGEPTGETKTVEVDDLTKPIMVEEEIENLETGKKELVTVQKHHTETRTKTVEVIELVEDEGKLERGFFKTSLGYIRRKVTMKDGTQKDFLADILPLLQVGVPVLTYDITGGQSKVLVTDEFIMECKQQFITDFYGE